MVHLVGIIGPLLSSLNPYESHRPIGSQCDFGDPGLFGGWVFQSWQRPLNGTASSGRL